MIPEYGNTPGQCLEDLQVRNWSMSQRIGKWRTLAKINAGRVITLTLARVGGEMCQVKLGATELLSQGWQIGTWTEWMQVDIDCIDNEYDQIYQMELKVDQDHVLY